MARDRLPPGLPDDGSGEHDAGDADARRRNRAQGRASICVRRKSARAGRRARTHALRGLRRASDRSPRLFHPGLRPAARWQLPSLSRENPRDLESTLRRSADGNPLSAARSHAPFRDMKPGVIQDVYGRPLRNLRVSVTDRCNLRCAYCMPEKDYVWLPREDMLQFEEIETLVDMFLDEGVDKVRLTGGEPLLRRDLPVLVERLASRPRIRDLALTTNGVLLAEHAGALKDAGLHRLTVSLDTLRHDRFSSLARFDELDRVTHGIDVATSLFGGLKIDTVVIRGVNDDELVDLIEFGRGRNAEIRFIEYMDVGGATQWSIDRVVSKAQILDLIAQRYGPPDAL